MWGLLRFLLFEDAFSILFTKLECFMVRLSRLLVGNAVSSVEAEEGKDVCGFAALATFARAEVRFFWMGAYGLMSINGA